MVSNLKKVLGSKCGVDVQIDERTGLCEVYLTPLVSEYDKYRNRFKEDFALQLVNVITFGLSSVSSEVCLYYGTSGSFSKTKVFDGGDIESSIVKAIDFVSEDDFKVIKESLRSIVPNFAYESYYFICENILLLNYSFGGSEESILSQLNDNFRDLLN